MSTTFYTAQIHNAKIRSNNETTHKKIAKLFGYHLVRFKQFEAECGISVESAAVNVINGIGGIGLVLDVGGNVGQYGSGLRKEGYTGTIHSFEPVADMFAQLSQACAADTDWTAHNIAMGAERETKSINVYRGKGLHSFYEPSAYGKAAFSEAKVVNTEQVTVSTVDNFLRGGVEGFSGKSVFLKMDTQGYDLRVFAGAGKSLAHIAAIQSELAFQQIYADMPNYTEVLKTYEAAGFKVAGFYPVSTDKNLTVITMDCILINQNHTL